MTSAFSFPGGAANRLSQIISLTTPTVIVPTNRTGQYAIAWFRCNEYAGGTPNLTVEIYDTASLVSEYLGSGGFTWITKAMTAKQSVLFDDGFVIPNGCTLRVTASVANQVLVSGLYVGRQSSSNWTPTGVPTR